MDICIGGLSLCSLMGAWAPIEKEIKWDAKGPRIVSERMRHFKMCLDSGAAAAALPREMVPDDCMVEEPSAHTCNTASGEHIEDGGKAKLVGRDSNGILRAVQGRVAEV